MQFRSSILFKIPTLLTHSNTFQGKEIVNYQKKEIFIPDRYFKNLSLEGNTFDMSACVSIIISLSIIGRKYI